MPAPRYAIISPVRDERAYLMRTLESVASQSLTPTRWVIVDDGSVDGTGELAREWAARHPWITVVSRAHQGSGGRGAPVVHAFAAGLAALGSDLDLDFLVKLDGDLSFPPDHFERLIDRFESWPALGIAGGALYEQTPAGAWIERSISAGSVWGADRMYRIACWRDIGGVAPAHGWDGIDEVEAQMRGWLTGTQHDLPFRHHKPEGQRAGQTMRYLDQGYGAHYMGYDPLYLLLRVLGTCVRQRRLVPSLMAVGYVTGYLRRAPQHPNAAARCFLRRRQRRRLLGLVGLRPRSVEGAAVTLASGRRAGAADS